MGGGDEALSASTGADEVRTAGGLTRRDLVSVWRGAPEEKIAPRVEGDVAPVPALTGDGACSGCGVCVALCPARALAVNDVGSRVLLAVDTTSCRGCGHCVDACPEGALALSTASVGGWRSVATATRPRCEGCGRRLGPGEAAPTCHGCRTRAALVSDVWERLDR